MSDLEITTPDRFDFSEPVKRIHDSQGLHLFQSSIALYELQKSLTKIVQLVENKEVPPGVLNKELLYTKEEIDQYSHDINVPIIPIFDQNSKDSKRLQKVEKTKPYINNLLQLFNEVSLLIDEIPPLKGPRRYGNLACREWHDKFESTIDEKLQRLIIHPFYKLGNPEGFIQEIKWYFNNSFGSKERLDYGTGHELNFLAFITGLWKVNILRKNEIDGYDFLIIFGRYYDLVRKLIILYTLEPAGSHGVWGLDDHFHISYILGSSQFINSSSKNYPQVSPKMVNNRSMVYQYSTRNLYFNSIAFIYKVKKGVFFEHSPILYDISNVKNWEKIQKGMLKMFAVEVVNKFPVVQHFYFGNVLFPWRSLKNGIPLPIHTSEQDLSNSQKNETNDSWKDKVSHNHSGSLNISGNNNVPLVTAPWKKSNNVNQSLQEKLISNGSGPGSRRPITNNLDTTTTAKSLPWSNKQNNNVSTTKAPWTNSQEGTKAPWSKR